MTNVGRTILLLALAAVAGSACAGEGSSPGTRVAVGQPGASPTSGAPAQVAVTPSPRPSDAPGATPEPRAADLPSRVVVPDLEIDLPVVSGDLIVAGNPRDYPLCDVAQYLTTYRYPGRRGTTTWVYAHAREGMFLPLLEESQTNNGERMLGMLVQVWTSDEQLFLYEITEVRPHQTDLDDALNADHEQLWLQTSEGPRGTVPKLQVVAEPLSSGPAPNPEDAHPEPKPVNCE